MTPGSAESPNRSRWMHAYARGLMEQPLLGMHDAANLERARTRAGLCEPGLGAGVAAAGRSGAPEQALAA